MDEKSLRERLRDMEYEVALEIVARENESRMAYDPDRLHRIDCQALFKMSVRQLAKHYNRSDIAIHYMLSGKSTPKGDLRHAMAIDTGLMESTLYQIFEIQRIEYMRSIGFYCKAPGIPPYLQKYFKPWVKRAPPNVTEKSLARDERRRGKNLAKEDENTDDNWIKNRLQRRRLRLSKVAMTESTEMES